MSELAITPEVRSSVITQITPGFAESCKKANGSIALAKLVYAEAITNEHVIKHNELLDSLNILNHVLGCVGETVNLGGDWITLGAMQCHSLASVSQINEKFIGDTFVAGTNTLSAIWLKNS